MINLPKQYFSDFDEVKDSLIVGEKYFVIYFSHESSFVQKLKWVDDGKSKHWENLDSMYEAKFVSKKPAEKLHRLSVSIENYVIAETFVIINGEKCPVVVDFGDVTIHSNTPID